MTMATRMVMVVLGVSGLVGMGIVGCAAKHECTGGACSVAPSTRKPAILSLFGAKETVGRGENLRGVVHANTANFHQEVLQADELVLVDFYADWCRPCQALAPVLEQIAMETPEAKVVKVNIDANPELAGRYGVQSIPTLLLFEKGQVADKSTGARSKSELKAMLANRNARTPIGQILSRNP